MQSHVYPVRIKFATLIHASVNIITLKPFL